LKSCLFIKISARVSPSKNSGSGINFQKRMIFPSVKNHTRQTSSLAPPTRGTMPARRFERFENLFPRRLRKTFLEGDTPAF